VARLLDNLGEAVFPQRERRFDLRARDVVLVGRAQREVGDRPDRGARLCSSAPNAKPATSSSVKACGATGATR
jgi:hypothetical protein